MQAGTLDKIGKYQILGQIGQGAVGVVYKALDPFIERVVAVKTVVADLDSDPEVRARFYREARSAGQLSHKNIVTIYDLGEEAGKAYMVMEFLDGNDLKTIIGRRENIPLAQKLEWMHELLEGLAHAHQRQVIHRDIKPGNIYITCAGQLKILDFGLARFSSSDITRTGSVMGTPNYMSPEQIRSEKVDHRSDIFSAGATFYELLTYRKPFDSNSLPSTFFKILQQDPEPVESIDPSIPVEFSKVIRRSMAKSPDQRYQSAGEMIPEIEWLQALVQQQEKEQRQLKEAEEERARRESRERSAAILREGRDALQSGDCSAARQALSGALALAPDMDGASTLAREIAEFEQQARARREREQRAVALLGHVRQSLAAGDDKAAGAHLDALLELDPGHPEADTLRTQVDEARTAREHRERERARRIASALTRATAAYEAEDFETAARLAREILGEEASHADALELLRKTEIGLRRQELERQIRNVLDRAEAIAADGDLQQAVAYLEQSQPQIAAQPAVKRRLQEYREQLRVQMELRARAEAERRERIEAGLARSRSSIDGGEYEHAIEEAQGVLAEDAGNRMATQVLAEARRRLAESKERQEVERKAQSLLEKAEGLFERDDLSAAVSILAGAEPRLAAVAGVTDALHRYSNTLKERREAEQRAATVRRQLENARSSLERNDPESCLRDLEAAFKIEPSEPEAKELQTRARQLIEQKQAEQQRKRAAGESIRVAHQALRDERYEDARAALDKAVELDPEDAEAVPLKLEIEKRYAESSQRQRAREAMGVASAALEKGDSAAAMQAVQDALTAWPDVPGGAKLRARIAKRNRAEQATRIVTPHQPRRYLFYAGAVLGFAVLISAFVYFRDGTARQGSGNQRVTQLPPQTPAQEPSTRQQTQSPAVIQAQAQDQIPSKTVDTGASPDVTMKTRRARQLFDAGNYEEAQKIITEALALSPGDRETVRLRTQLVRRQQKEVESAFERLQQGRKLADDAHAQALAPDTYKRAQMLETEATRLSRGGSYPEAAARVVDALNAYAAAETEASHAAKAADQERIRSAQRADADGSRQEFEQARSRAAAAGADKKAVNPFREASELARQAQAQFERGDFATARAAFQTATANMLRAADAATSDQREWEELRGSRDISALQAFARKYSGSALAEQALRRAEQLDWESVNRKDVASLKAFLKRHPDGANASQATAEISRLAQDETSTADRAGVRQALARYAEAYQRMDARQLKDTWPTIPPETLNTISASFRTARSMQMDLQPLDEAVITGDTAVISCQRLISQLFDKKPLQAQDRITIRLRRRGAGWVIESIQ